MIQLKRTSALAITLCLLAGFFTSCGKSDAPSSEAKTKDSTVAIDTTEPAKVVTMDSSHVISYRPKVGETRKYRLRITSDATMDVTDQLLGGPSGKHTAKSDATFIIRQVIRGVNKDSSVNVSYFLESADAMQQQDTSKLQYSSANQAQRNDIRYAHFNAMIGKEIKLTISKNGDPDPKSVKGIEEIAKETLKTMPDSVKNNPQLEMMRGQQVMGIVAEWIRNTNYYLPVSKISKDSSRSQTRELNIPITEQIIYPMTVKSTEGVRGFEERAGKVVAIFEATEQYTPNKSVIEQAGTKANLQNYHSNVKGIARIEDATGQLVHRTANSNRGYTFTLESKQQPGKMYRVTSNAVENIVVEMLP